jgi:transcriptional regulator with XRE-family HTH domain
MKILCFLVEEMKKYGIRNIARKTGIAECTLRNWVSGKAVPTLSKAQIVANAMGMDFFLFPVYDGV